MATEQRTWNLERANLIRTNLCEADLTDFLCKVPLFSGLDRVTRAKLAAHLEPVAVQQGEIVVREGDRGDALYLLDGARGEHVVHLRHVRHSGRPRDGDALGCGRAALAVDAGCLGRVRPHGEPADGGAVGLGAIRRHAPRHDATRPSCRRPRCARRNGAALLGGRTLVVAPLLDAHRVLAFRLSR